MRPWDRYRAAPVKRRAPPIVVGDPNDQPVVSVSGPERQGPGIGPWSHGASEQADGTEMERRGDGLFRPLGRRPPRAPATRISSSFVTQVSALGPLGLEYLDPVERPRDG